MIRARAGWAVLAFGALTGCASDPSALIEREKVNVTSEEVTVTPDQVLCGERAGLWKIEQGNHGALGLLSKEARSLGFADDVVMGDTHFQDPYVQLSGAQQLKVAKVTSLKEDDASTKTVTGNVGVVIKHSCFPTPLPLHGTEGGRFSQTAEVRILLRNQKVDRILH